MNGYQNRLYNDLMKLCDENDAFYYTDQQVEETWYRIFLHRLASYTDFLEPNALEGRGVMFEMNAEGKDAFPVYLSSLPFCKFFNVNENPFTMDPDWSDVVAVENKMDGSLMSTYLHSLQGKDVFLQGKDVLKLKSKGSTQSPHCQDAMEWLELEENDGLYYELKEIAYMGYTVIMEWTSPDNRIVLGYEKPALTVLAIRYNQDGSYVTRDGLMDHWVEIHKAWVEEYLDYVKQDYDSVEEFVECIPDLKGIEGYVITLGSGQRIKVKCDEYKILHKNKDNINCPRRLFEAVIDEVTDDLRTLFTDDLVALKQIEEMEKFAGHHYNHMCDSVERFYERNKHLERKEYAILGQKELIRPYFGLAMMKYTGKEPNYKESIKKRWRELGLKDEVLLEEGED